MKLPREVIALLQRRFDSNHRDWLAAPASAAWPLTVALGVPSEQQARSEVDAVRGWVDSWRNWQGGGQVAWITRQWKVLGMQRLPASIAFYSAEEVARCIGQEVRWARVCQRFAVLAQRWPALSAALARTYAALAEYDDADFERLLNLLGWLLAHPNSGLYPRQLPVEGLDSKWLESRKGVLSELLWRLGPAVDEAADFYAVCGLQRPSSLIRMRVLDPTLRAQMGGLADIAAPLRELAKLPLMPAHVLIVENLQTGLSLPDLPGSIAFMGLGYGVDVLKELAWLGGARKIYWGDIDTHGFAILHRARAALGNVTSLLMDLDTLQTFEHLAGEEPAQATVNQLPLLSTAEAAIFAGLKGQQWGHCMRLEQERIAWPYALQELARLY